MLIVFLRTLILYGIVIIGMRLMGKRQLGELQPSELVITFLISNIATLPIEDSSVPLMSGAIPILTLMCFEVILSWLGMKNRRLRTLLSGTPRIIIKDGIIDQNELAMLRYSVDDLMEQLRVAGIFDLQEVDMAVVETTGQLSVSRKVTLQPPTVTDMGIKKSPAAIPALVVSDGDIVEQGLKLCGISREKLQKLLHKRKMAVQDIFLMTCTTDGTVFIVPKDQEGRT